MGCLFSGVLAFAKFLIYGSICTLSLSLTRNPSFNTILTTREGNENWMGFQQVNLPLTLIQNQWIVLISVGSPPQSFNAMIDTGSAYTWFSSSLCESAGCLQHHKFYPHLSNTFSLLSSNNDLTLLKFGSGTLEFVKGKDTICLNDIFCLRNQSFGLVTKENDDIFSIVPFDGIIGLSFPGIARSRTDSITESICHEFENIFSKRRPFSPIHQPNLHRSSSFDQPISTYIMFNLSSRSSPHISFIPSIHLDRHVENSKIKWFKTWSDSYWTLPLKDILVNNIAMNLCYLYIDHMCQVILDTGTTEILGPPDDVKLIRDTMGLNQDCSSWSNLKNLTFQFVSTPSSNSGSELFEIVVTPQQLLSGDDSSSIPDLDCNKGILPGSMFSDSQTPDTSFDPKKLQWILGNSFLKHINFILHPDEHRIGIFQNED